MPTFVPAGVSSFCFLLKILLKKVRFKLFSTENSTQNSTILHLSRFYCGISARVGADNEIIS